MNRVFCTIGPTLAALALGIAPSLAAIPRPIGSPLSPTPGQWLALEGSVATVLFFETESMAVRIYRQGSDLFMNLYNKANDVVEARGIPARIVPSTRDQTVYRADRGEAERLARIDIRGETELEIRAANGTLVLKESGFNAVVGVPSGSVDFQGNNFLPGTPAVVLSSEAARLRSQPRLGSSIVGLAPRRAVVEVIDRVGNPEDSFIWYQVTYQGVTGWVRGDLLQPT
jgi:hypothetical protein